MRVDKSDHVNIVGNCPDICDISDDPCDRDIEMCEDCYLCKGQKGDAFLVDIAARKSPMLSESALTL